MIRKHSYRGFGIFIASLAIVVSVSSSCFISIGLCSIK